MIFSPETENNYYTGRRSSGTYAFTNSQLSILYKTSWVEQNFSARLSLVQDLHPISFCGTADIVHEYLYTLL
jgi:hypothetical protein